MSGEPVDDPAGLWEPVSVTDLTAVQRQDLLAAEAATKALRIKRAWLKGVVDGAFHYGEKYVGGAAATALGRIDVELEQAFDLENTARAVLGLAMHEAAKANER